MTTTAPALAAVIDALVAQPVDALPVGLLMEQVAAVAPQAAPLEGWLQ